MSTKPQRAILLIFIAMAALNMTTFGSTAMVTKNLPELLPASMKKTNEVNTTENAAVT